MAVPILVLFDIDGTLLIDDAHAHGRAMVRAMRSVYGIDLPDDAVERVRPWGKTDLQIVREALEAGELSADEVEARRDAWVAEAAARFKEESSAAWDVRTGVADAVQRLAAAGMRLTLLTGNLRAIAARKVELMGIADAFDVEIGAYGDDAEDRTRLVPIARRRAGGPWPRARTVVVGDTPADVATARADQVRSIVFASARYPRRMLTGADVVIDGSDELVSVLERMRAA